MIERLPYGEGYEAVCDCCGTTLNELDWDDTICALKAEGWKFEKVGDEWLHYCPTCRKEMRAEEFEGV